jgi:hypothetical protein
MPTCTPITISNCPRQVDCESCKEIVSTSCIKYYGEGVPSLGITAGMTLTEILLIVGEAIQTLSGEPE